jgi:hypothetical protein
MTTLSNYILENIKNGGLVSKISPIGRANTSHSHTYNQDCDDPKCDVHPGNYIASTEKAFESFIHAFFKRLPAFTFHCIVIVIGSVVFNYGPLMHLEFHSKRSCEA